MHCEKRQWRRHANENTPEQNASIRRASCDDGGNVDISDMSGGGMDVSDAGSLQFGVRLALAAATWTPATGAVAGWTSATPVRFNSVCVLRWP